MMRMRNVLRFVLWCQSQKGPPLPADVQANFRVSRATAYRWVALYHDSVTSMQSQPTSTQPYATKHNPAAQP